MTGVCSLKRTGQIQNSAFYYRAQKSKFNELLWRKTVNTSNSVTGWIIGSAGDSPVKTAIPHGWGIQA